MTSRSGYPRPWWHRPLAWVGATLGPAGLLLWGSWVAEPWLSGVLANAGVTVLLLVPATLYADWHRRTLERVEAKADKAVAGSARAATIAEDIRTDVEVLSSAVERLTGAEVIAEELRQEQLAAIEGDMALFDRWGTAADRISTVEALRFAGRVGLVSTSGYRAPLFETSLHLRFRLEEPRDELTLTVERDDGTVEGSEGWPPGRPPSDVYRAIEAIVAGSGQQPASHWVLSLPAVKQAATALRFAVGRRATPILHGDNFRALIEFTGDQGDEDDGWYVAEYGLFPREHPHYVVETRRLGEHFWEEHLRGKGWYGAVRALEIARALNGIPDPAIWQDADRQD